LSDLATIRERIRADDPKLKASYAALLKRSERALKAPLRSVTQKRLTPASGSKHDYMSMGPYWWPNPDTKDGLPYVRRDGKRNPEVAGDALDADRLVSMANDARDLALSYYFTDDVRYAAKCADVLRTWFIDPATRMNPNLRFGQAIPGIVDGRGAGLIDSRHFWLAIDAALLIEASRKFTAVDLAEMRRWFADFATWMIESDVGLEEASAYNNHGVFFDAQLATYLRFINEPVRARRVVFSAATLRVAGQIDRDGNMPFELERTRPFHYTTFALQAAMQLAHHGEALDAAREVSAIAAPARAEGASERCNNRQIQCRLNLWNADFDGRSLKRAVTSVAQTIVEPGTWKYKTEEEPSPPLFRALPVLLMAQRLSRDAPITAAVGALRAREGAIAEDVSWLMWPVS
jgi:hypothetical protein